MFSTEQNPTSHTLLCYSSRWKCGYKSVGVRACALIGMSSVCLQKLCLLSHQYTEVLTFPGQSLTNITHFLAVCLTCCHTAASFPNPGEEVGNFDWLIHYWFWWTKDYFRRKLWSWAAPQGVTEQLLKNAHTAASAASSVKKIHRLDKSPWARGMESQSWCLCGQTGFFGAAL